MIDYLTLEQVGLINERQGGGGFNIADVAGIEAAIARPRSTFSGVDLFPTLWDKAGVLLHGLCSTQYFADGNKRTAWMSAVTFLEGNGVIVPVISDVEAEAFVLAVSTVHDFDAARAAEWFHERCGRSVDRPGPVADPRLEYLMLAGHAESTPDALLQVFNGHTFGCQVEALPIDLTFGLATRIHWTEADFDADLNQHVFEVYILAPGASNAYLVHRWLMGRVVRGGHPHHPNGLIPQLVCFDFNMTAVEPGLYSAVAVLNDAMVGQIPFMVEVMLPVADSPAGL